MLYRINLLERYTRPLAFRLLYGLAGRPGDMFNRASTMQSDRRLCRRVLSTLVLVAALAGAAQGQERRVALIIGNSAYKSVDRLLNPANDARLIAATLKESGFTVMILPSLFLTGTQYFLAYIFLTSNS